MADDRLATLISRWRARGVRMRDGASESELLGFERRHRMVLPADFRTFLRSVNGMDEGNADPDTQIRFWSLGEIRSAAEMLPEEEVHGQSRSGGFYIFADYSILAHAYAIRLNVRPEDVSTVVIAGGDSLVHVATSFSHFLDKYVEDPGQLF